LESIDDFVDFSGVKNFCRLYKDLFYDGFGSVFDHMFCADALHLLRDLRPLASIFFDGHEEF
jgi:hypothetical protein